MDLTANSTEQPFIGSDSPHPLLSVKMVAELLDVSTRKVYRLADAGKMPKPIKLGGSTRWLKSELENWLANRCRAVKAA